MQSIDRVMAILKCFSAEKTYLSLAEIHHETGLSKSSLQRLLNSLVHHNFLEKDEKNKTYKLGIELYFLGQLVDLNTSLYSIAKPYMEKLRDQFAESVSLNVIRNNQRICIGYVKGNHELTTLSYVGQTSPLYTGASAKLLLAFLPESEQKAILEKLSFDKISKNTILSKEQLMKELKRIKEDCVSISFEERISGAFSISAPIKNRNYEVIAAISISAPLLRVDEEKINLYRKELIRVGKEISKNL